MTAKKAEKKWYDEKGPGRKECPNPDCKVYVGAKSVKCPKCGAAIPKKTESQPTTKKGKTQPKDGFGVLDEFITRLEAVGGLKKVKTLIEQRRVINEQLQGLEIDGDIDRMFKRVEEMKERFAKLA
jgi:adenine-specific DNA methylase